ncbi:MAG: TolC family protein [Cyclobacteriaceae bacterium]
MKFNYHYRYVVVVVLSFAFFNQSLAQTPEENTFSIQECIEYAGLNNKHVKIARIDERIAEQQTAEVRGRGLPQANINGSLEDRLKIPLLVIPGGIPGSQSGGDSGNGDNAEGQGIPLGYQYNSALTGEVTQMIFDPSFWVGLKAAKSSSQLYQQQTKQVSEETAYQIASAYYQVIVVQKQRQLLQTNLESTESTLTTTQLQFENGVAKQVDVSRLRVNASNLTSQIAQAELQIKQALNNLKYQMGMPLDQSIALSDTALNFQNEKNALTDIPDDFYKNRIDYQILQTNLALQKLDEKNNRVGYFPKLTAYANYGYQAQGADLGLYATSENGWVDYTTASLGLRLSIPVFDGLQRHARIQQSKLKSQQLEENITLTHQAIDLETSNASSQYQSTLQRIEAEQQNVDLAQQVYEVTQLEFREGVGTSTDVVEAETALRQAQNTYINSLLDLYVARLDLENAKGNLLPYLKSL